MQQPTELADPKVTSPSITTPTMDGDRHQIILGVSLDLKMVDGREGKPMVIDGQIRLHRLDRNTQFKLIVRKDGELDPSVKFFSVIELDGDNWENLVTHEGLDTDGGGKDFETIIPVFQEGRNIVTKSNSNALKIITLSHDGVYNEWTVTIVIQMSGHGPQAYLLQQHNYCEQVYRDEVGIAFLPRTRTRGSQPKRLAIVEIVKREMSGVELPLFANAKFVEAPTGKDLRNGQARIVWWSAHRQVGGAVTHTGEQVQVFSGHLLSDHFYLEPGTKVQYRKIVGAGAGTSFRHALQGVSVVDL